MPFRPSTTIFASLAIFLLTFTLLSASVTCAQSAQSTNLQEAQDAVAEAFNAVVAAEKAGANTEGLVIQLNNAASLVAKAENLARTGEADDSSANAAAAVFIARQVQGLAQTAEQSAKVSTQDWLTSSLILAIVGSIVLVLVLLLAWRFVKRRYVTSVFGGSREVIEA